MWEDSKTIQTCKKLHNRNLGRIQVLQGLCRQGGWTQCLIRSILQTEDKQEPVFAHKKN